MKLKIYDENSVNDVDGQLFLKLKIDDNCPYDCEHDNVCLVVVDKNGHSLDDGSILVIDNEFNGIVVLKNINNIIPIKTSLLEKYPLMVTEDELQNKLKEEMHRHFHDKVVEKMQKEEHQHASKH